MREVLCPICGALVVDSGHNRDARQCDCPRCGKFQISGTAVAMLAHRLNDLPSASARLQHAVRRRTELEPWLFITSNNLDSLLAERLPDYLRRRFLLMQWLAKRLSENETDFVETTDNNVVALIGVSTPQGVRQHIADLVAEGFVEEKTEIRAGILHQFWRLTTAGWREFERNSGVIVTGSDQFDLFISHASEDKAPFVDSLVSELKALDLGVWYDSTVLQIGDSLRRSIDLGLARSRFGVVILSPSFFAKDWPQRELDGLVALETVERPRILPIWHGLTRAEVTRFSPTLADRVALQSSKGAYAIAAAIREKLQSA